MFTGIVTDVGRVSAVETGGDTRFVIETAYDPDTIDLGASIACSGVCLTVVDKGVNDSGRNWFAVDASEETLGLTNCRAWKAGSKVNLERALRLGDELGGHFVLGHVDGVGKVASMENEGDSIRFTFEIPKELMRYIAPKGSVVLNGVSLTINEVYGPDKGDNFIGFGVNIIPHTAENTTFGAANIGDAVNVEVDSLARYVARLMEYKD